MFARSLKDASAWLYRINFSSSRSVALASLELTEIRLFLECCRVRKACAPHPANFSLEKKKKIPETNGKGSWRQPWAPVYPNCLHFKNVTFFSVTVLRHWPPSQDTICVFSSLFSDIAQTQDLSRSVLFALIGLKTLPPPPLEKRTLAGKEGRWGNLVSYLAGRSLLS